MALTNGHDDLRIKNGGYGILSGCKGSVKIGDELYEVVSIEPHGFVFYWDAISLKIGHAHSCFGNVYSGIISELVS